MSGASLPKEILFFLAFVAFLLEHTPLRSDVTPSSDIWLPRQMQYSKTETRLLLVAASYTPIPALMQIFCLTSDT